jgi:FkbM family methyltransferase
MSYKALKAFARTRSLSFTRDYVSLGSQPPSNAEGQVDWWSGDGKPLHYREGTSDISIAYDVLFKPGRKSEYWLPEGLEAETILDIGGNIGIAARYLAHRYPRASIHSFEPIPENYRLLRRNVEGSNVTVHPYALGARSGSVEFRNWSGEDNRGFYSLARAPTEGETAVRAEMRSVSEALESIGAKQVDVIKIDVEGAEHEILSAFPEEVLRGTTWIYGELHAERLDPRLAFDVLQRLSPWFDIEVHKQLRKRNWFFDACNREASARFRGFRRGRR